VELHLATQMTELPWFGRAKQPSEVYNWMKMMSSYGYMLLDRHDNPLCPHCSELLLGKVTCGPTKAFWSLPTATAAVDAAAAGAAAADAAVGMQRPRMPGGSVSRWACSGEESPLQLQCPGGQVITEIGAVRYGACANGFPCLTRTLLSHGITQNAAWCTEWRPHMNCRYTAAAAGAFGKAVLQACVGKQRCDESAEILLAAAGTGDPCPGYRKMMHVSVVCAAAPVADIEAAKTPVGAAPPPGGGDSGNAKLRRVDIPELHEQPNVLDGCSHVYLDVGTNVGVQIRKLYEGPSVYPNSVVHQIFDKYFGKDHSKVCVIGFEPNPHHFKRLREIQRCYRALGFRVSFVFAAVASTDGQATFSLDGAKQYEEWGCVQLYTIPPPPPPPSPPSCI